MPTAPFPQQARPVLLASTALFALLLLFAWSGNGTSAAYPASSTPTTVPLTRDADGITVPYCWQFVPAPDAGQPWSEGSMWGISALSPSSIWALAKYRDAGGIDHTSAAHWNGTIWSLVPIPTLPLDGTLNDLVAISDNDIWVVGYDHVTIYGGEALTMHWNGSQWSIIPSPGGHYPNQSLVAVDASSSNNVWAVGQGYYFSPPRGHDAVKGHSGGDIEASGAGNFSAVGDNTAGPGPAVSDGGYAEGLVLRWNGIQWDFMDTQMGGTYGGPFEAVQAISPSSVWVGGQGPALLYWNGASWINATPPSPNQVDTVYAVAALSLTDVWVSGFYYNPPPGQTRLLHSNGSQWAAVPVYGLSIRDIEPIASHDIWASAITSLLHWDGRVWEFVPLAQDQYVQDLAALSSNDVWAVGSYDTGSDRRMLILHYNPSCVPTPIPTATRTPSPGPPTNTATVTPTSTPDLPPCPGERFTDVCPPDYFYPYVQALADDGILSGYSTSPPCPNSLWIPCFRPYNSSTRGQIAKVVSLAASFTEPVTGQTFEDVPPASTFYTYTERMAQRGIISGYPCGGPYTPCIPPENRPYFRPNNNVTRGQLSKMIANAFNFTDPASGQTFQDVPPGSTFYEYIASLYARSIINGYPCGTPSRPCVPPNNLPYFQPNNDVTRGQTAKIVQLARTQPTPTPTPSPTAAQATLTATPTFTETPTPDLTGTPTSTTPTLR